MKIRPLFDRVVIEPIDAEEKTASGIVLPDGTHDISFEIGGVVDGKEIKMEVKVGDKVLCSKYAGSEFKVDGKEVTILRQSDILAVVD